MMAVIFSMQAGGSHTQLIGLRQPRRRGEHEIVRVVTTVYDAYISKKSLLVQVCS